MQKLKNTEGRTTEASQVSTARLLCCMQQGVPPQSSWQLSSRTSSSLKPMCRWIAGSASASWWHSDWIPPANQLAPAPASIVSSWPSASGTWGSRWPSAWGTWRLWMQLWLRRSRPWAREYCLRCRLRRWLLLQVLDCSRRVAGIRVGGICLMSLVLDLNIVFQRYAVKQIGCQFRSNVNISLRY